jgi:membrane protein
MAEPITFQSLREVLACAWARWNDINAPRLGAALAFYTLWAIAPLLMVCLAIAGLVFGPEVARHQLGLELHSLVGGAAGALEMLLSHAAEPSNNIVAAAVGFAILFLGASGVFAELHDSLNLVWGIENPEGTGLMGTVITRFLGFLMVLGIGVLMLVSLAVSAGVAFAGHFFGQYLPLAGGVLAAANAAASLVMMTVLFALLFKLVPQTDIEWGDVWIGAAVTSVLFTAGKFLIGWYLGTFGVNSAYGAASSLVIFIIWVYYSAQILFLGAEFTRAFAERHGSRARRPRESPLEIEPRPRRLA